MTDELPTLRGAEHPYHFRARVAEEFISWQAFIDWGMFDSDPNLNVLWRWDWVDYEWDDERGELYLYWMQQYKGQPRCQRVNVQAADEPEIRAWLTERAKTVAAIWAPITVVV